MQNNKSEEHHTIHSLGKAYTGGPKGFGDPEDRSMRHVESFVLVTQIVKDRAHLVKCKDLVKDWGECMESTGFSSIFKCKEKLSAMNKCLAHWYTDKEFRKECEEIYLEKRKRFRETGIIEKEEKKQYYSSKKSANINYAEILEKLNKESKGN